MEVPAYVKTKKEDLFSWIDRQKNARLIRILIVIMMVLSFLAGILWLFLSMLKAYSRGGVGESDKILRNFAAMSVIKTVLTPVFPM